MILLGSLLLAAGCAHPAKPDDQPAMVAGTGAIAGKLVGTDGGPFDLALSGDKAEAAAVTIELTSPSTGVIATTRSRPGKPEFVFSDVKPGTYELGVYRVVPGERTIAGSQPVTINAGEVARPSVTL